MTNDAINKFLNGIDWPLLQKQKDWLTQQHAGTEEAEGILGLIDAIQDFAVDEANFPANKVFGRFGD